MNSKLIMHKIRNHGPQEGQFTETSKESPFSHLGTENLDTFH